MTCPYLKEVVMLHCEACPFSKMLPLDRIASASPCLAPDYVACSIYRETAKRGASSPPPFPVFPDATELFRERDGLPPKHSRRFS
jgi:hypothetical protein